MSLLQWGDFLLHSGGRSWWRIDCDSFTDSEAHIIARLILDKVGEVDVVLAPDSHYGGFVRRLKAAVAEQLGTHKPPDGRWRVLIVDDVLTTGASMEERKNQFIEQWKEQEVTMRRGFDIKGCVVFARGECPDWVQSLFQVNV